MRDALSPSSRLKAAVQMKRRLYAHLAEDTIWRAWLLKTVGSERVSKMLDADLRRILVALDKLNNQATTAYSPSEQLGKIQKLWSTAAAAGAIEDGSEAAMSAFIKRMTSQDIGQLPTHKAAKVIEALKAMVARKETEHAR